MCGGCRVDGLSRSLHASISAQSGRRGVRRVRAGAARWRRLRSAGARRAWPVPGARASHGVFRSPLIRPSACRESMRNCVQFDFCPAPRTARVIRFGIFALLWDFLASPQIGRPARMLCTDGPGDVARPAADALPAALRRVLSLPRTVCAEHTGPLFHYVLRPTSAGRSMGGGCGAGDAAAGLAASPTFDPARGAARAWLCTFARHLVIDAPGRARQAWPAEAGGEALERTAEQTPGEDEIKQALQAGRLPTASGRCPRTTARCCWKPTTGAEPGWKPHGR